MRKNNETSTMLSFGRNVTRRRVITLAAVVAGCAPAFLSAPVAGAAARTAACYRSSGLAGIPAPSPAPAGWSRSAPYWAQGTSPHAGWLTATYVVSADAGIGVCLDRNQSTFTVHVEGFAYTSRCTMYVKVFVNRQPGPRVTPTRAKSVS